MKNISVRVCFVFSDSSTFLSADFQGFCIILLDYYEQFLFAAD